jgi:non-specific serine/threonine protein kinase
VFIDCIGNDRYLIKDVDYLLNGDWGRVKDIPGIEQKKDYEGNLNAIVLHRSHVPTVHKYYPAIRFEEYSSRRLSNVATLPYRLRDYQKEAVDFIRQRNGVLLAHDMGMGKTGIVLEAAIYPALVLVPTTAITVWEKEATNAGLKIQILQGRKSAASLIDKSADLFITTYGSVKYWLPYFKEVAHGPELGTIIADEAHYLQRIKVEAAKSFRSVRRELTILASATPVPNRLRSLWGLLDATSHGAWGTHWDFRKRYCGALPGQYGGLIDFGVTNADELAARVQEVMIRRTWDEPGFEELLPELERQIIDVEITLDARIQMNADAIARAFSKLRTSGADAGTLRYLTAQRRLLGEYKIRAIIEQGFFDETEGNRQVFYVWHKDSARMLAEALMKRGGHPVDVLMGTSTGKHRKAVLKEWEEGPVHQPRSLVATLSTASESVNLITADTAYFLEFDWAPRRIVQAEKRHHRPGNVNNTVYAHYVTLRGTIEDRIAHVLLDKVGDHESALGKDGHRKAIMTLFDNEDFEYEETGDALEDLANRLIATK